MISIMRQLEIKLYNKLKYEPEYLYTTRLSIVNTLNNFIYYYYF